VGDLFVDRFTGICHKHPTAAMVLLVSNPKGCTQMAKLTHKSRYLTATGANLFDQWAKSPVKLGPVPTEAQLGVVHTFKRGGGKESVTMAMALRDCGVSVEQMLGASALFDGNPTASRNTIDKFIKAGMFEGGWQGGVCHITLAPRGKAWVDAKAKAALEAPAKPALVKGKPAMTDGATPKASNGKAKATVDKAVKAKAARKPKAPKPAPVVDQPVDQPAIDVATLPAPGTGDGTGEASTN
jgi:hypothetical protein